jgi:hypothetical protein
MAYQVNPGTTGNMSDGGEYDNFDEVTSAQYPNAAASSAAQAALSAEEAAASKTAAATSATNAANSATAASTSANNAATSATNAANSATSAGTSATSAANSATSASTSATSATNSATSASTSATSATNSATSASTSATNSASSASASAASASTATTQAGIATTQASNAANSATSASNSATSASTSATTATTQAGIATTQASNASTSATAANTSAVNASSSASAANSSAISASNSASTATTQATSATNSATSAAASATSAAASYDSFDDRYLGSKASDPSLDNDGNPLITGAMYFNSTNNIMRVFSGISWINTPGIATGGTTGQVLAKLSSTNYDTQWISLTGGLSYSGTWNASTNSPTLTSSVGTIGSYYVVSTSGNTNLNGITDWVIGDWAIFNGSFWQKIDQTNLVTSVAGRTGAVTLSNTDISGLGTAATTNSTAYATAAQGTKADTAVQTITSTDGSIVVTPSGTTVNLAVSEASPASTLLTAVRNTTGATLTKGTAVYISGATGQIKH